MSSLWMAREPVLRRAWLAFVVCALLAASSAAFGAWDASRHDWQELGARAVAWAVSQYGAHSPEARAAVQQMGRTPDPKDVVALLDPATGAAITAWPEELSGKKPEEMRIAGSSRLPPIHFLMQKRHFHLLAPAAATSSVFGPFRTSLVTLHVVPLYGWVAEEEPDPPPPPEALLVVAAPPGGVTVLGMTANVLGVLAVLALLLYWVSVTWWVFKDAAARGDRAFAWGLLTLVTNLVGFAVYLIVRQERRQCPGCGAPGDRRFAYCGRCGHPLKRSCSNCGETLRHAWPYCTRCGAPADATGR